MTKRTVGDSGLIRSDSSGILMSNHVTDGVGGGGDAQIASDIENGDGEATSFSRTGSKKSVMSARFESGTTNKKTTGATKKVSPSPSRKGKINYGKKKI